MKTRLLAVILALFSACWCSAQTAEETISWLQAKLGESYNSALNRTVNILTARTIVHATSYPVYANNTPMAAIEASFANIRAISWKRLGGDKPGLTLAFSGDFTDYSDWTYRDKKRQGGNEYEHSRRATNTLVIDLKPDMADADVIRLVKAFSHLAELAGAKLVKDDLF